MLFLAKEALPAMKKNGKGTIVYTGTLQSYASLNRVINIIY